MNKNRDHVCRLLTFPVWRFIDHMVFFFLHWWNSPYSDVPHHINYYFLSHQVICDEIIFLTWLKSFVFHFYYDTIVFFIFFFHLPECLCVIIIIITLHLSLSILFFSFTWMHRCDFYLFIALYHHTKTIAWCI